MSATPLKGKTFKYGMPIYGLAWPEGDIVYMCGGGGMGIKNRLVCAESRRGQLTDQVAEYLFGEDCPMRLAITPNKKSIVFAMGQGGIRRLDLDAKGKVPKFTEITGDLQERLAEIKGEVKCMCFNPSGSHLAIGFVSGDLQVFEWPSLKVKMNLSGDKKLGDAVRDVDFSQPSTSNSSSSAASGSAAKAAQAAGAAPGGRSMHVLAATLDDGTCELWDWERELLLCKLQPGKMKQKLERTIMVNCQGRTVVQQLPRGTERVQISKIRFARDGTGDLLTLLNSPTGAHVARWRGASSLSPARSAAVTQVSDAAAAAASETKAGEEAAAAQALLQLVSCKKVSDDPCTGFETSSDGTLLSFGTSEGGVVVASATSCALLRKVPKAHMVFATGVTFSHNDKYVVTVSADASACVTSITAASRAAATRVENGSQGWARVVKLVIILLAILLTVALQVVRVLKSNYGMTTADIKAMVGRVVGLKLGKDEL